VDIFTPFDFGVWGLGAITFYNYYGFMGLHIMCYLPREYEEFIANVLLSCGWSNGMLIECCMLSSELF
jgi:hypothetical protein